MSDNDTRLAELREKDTLTNDEMEELVRLSPPGTFHTLPNLLTLGVVDLAQFTANMREGPDRSRVALAHGCYLEVLSLRLQHMDFWLRAFWVAKNPRRKVFEADDKRTFGTLITDCERLGVEPGLVARMRQFNADRVDGIHKYLLGVTSYEALKETCLASQGLDGEVRAYVCGQAGVPWQPCTRIRLGHPILVPVIGAEGI
jgi:hypothetical protein